MKRKIVLLFVVLFFSVIASAYVTQIPCNNFCTADWQCESTQYGGECQEGPGQNYCVCPNGYFCNSNGYCETTQDDGQQNNFHDNQQLPNPNYFMGCTELGQVGIDNAGNCHICKNVGGKLKFVMSNGDRRCKGRCIDTDNDITRPGYAKWSGEKTALFDSCISEKPNKINEAACLSPGPGFIEKDCPEGTSCVENENGVGYCSSEENKCKNNYEYTSNPNFPGKKLIDLGKLEFEVEKRDIGSTGAHPRGGRLRTEIHRYFSADEGKMVGYIKSTLIKRWDGKYIASLENGQITKKKDPKAGVFTLHSSRGVQKAIAEGLAETVYVSLEGVISDRDRKTVKREIEARLDNVGESVKTILDNDKTIKIEIDGAMFEFNLLISSEEAMFKAPLVNEIVDAGMYDDSGNLDDDPIEIIELAVMDGSKVIDSKRISWDRAGSSGVSVKDEEKAWLSQKPLVLELYRKWVSDPTNPDSEAFFEKLREKLESVKDCFTPTTQPTI